MNKAQQNSPASDRLLNSLRYYTGMDTTYCNINTSMAMNLLDNVKNGWNIESDLRSYGATGTYRVKEDLNKVFNEAHSVAFKTAEEADVVLDEYKEVVVNIRPGNCSFANFLKKQGLAQKDKKGGVSFVVNKFPNSRRNYIYALTFGNLIKDKAEKILVRKS